MPPISDGMSGNGGGVMGNADNQSAAIVHNIVNGIGLFEIYRATVGRSVAIILPEMS
jgi:hypothetical protein